MEKDCTVYRDERYALVWEDELPFIIINNEKYKLTCHPYEPCLYITDKDGKLTAVHNSFDPSDVLWAFSKGMVITSITGMEYDALDFCRMVEYAAGRGNIGIDAAEKVFGDRTKKKPSATKDLSENTERKKSVFTVPEGVSVIEKDPFYDLIDRYPDSVVDYCLIKNETEYEEINSHWAALLCAALKIIAEDWELNIDAVSIKAKKITSKELFAPAAEKSGTLNYRKAFLSPPYINNYTDTDFEKINATLFPNGTDELEIFEWTTDWSEYFDEGHEWWGTLCLTVYDKTLDRFVVIMASATD